ncbi:hypothetical protein BC834DRAFT_830725, partial [Gloeopeniophorella convolvens]
LFSVIVTAFCVESYQQLRRDPCENAVFFLQQISQQLAVSSSGSSVPPLSSPPEFHAPWTSIRLNILWFSSLALSLTGAFLTVLVQGWSRSFFRVTHRRSSNTFRHWLRLRTFMYDGVIKVKTTYIFTALTTIIHISLFLFFAGLVDFLFAFESTVAIPVLVVATCLGGAYVVFSVFQLMVLNSPCRTPLTPVPWHRQIAWLAARGGFACLFGTSGDVWPNSGTRTGGGDGPTTERNSLLSTTSSKSGKAVTSSASSTLGTPIRVRRWGGYSPGSWTRWRRIKTSRQSLRVSIRLSSLTMPVTPQRYAHSSWTSAHIKMAPS